jgi:hypothetical protein
MDRRSFLKVSACASAAASVGAVPAVASERTVVSPTPLEIKGTVREPARKIPVIDSADVVVLGGGPSGVAAAVSAARQGVDVILVEKSYCLGGLWTSGCVLPLNNTRAITRDGKWSQVVFGVSEEVCSRLSAMGMLISAKKDTPIPDPEAAKYVLEQMVQENKVRLLYDCRGAGVVMSGDRIDSVIIESKSGRVAIKAKAVVDCSGDGDVLEWAGEDFEVRKHHIGAMWRCGNAENLQRRGASDTPVRSVKYLHTTGEKNQDGLDIYNTTRLRIKMRKHMWDTLEADRKLPGCEDLFLLDSGSILGVRITRVLNSVFNVPYAGSMDYTAYDDCIGIGGADPVHTYEGGKMKGFNRPAWQIPYRSIVPKKVPNLLVAGRCFGFDDKLTYDAREVGVCFVTGQAAGNAAALSVIGRCSVRDVDVKRLQEVLKAQGAHLSC